MRGIDDIKAVVYHREDAEEEIVRRFISLPGRIILEVSEDCSEERAVQTLGKRGFASKEVVVLKRFRGRLFQPCPCSPRMVRCGYRVINNAFNCLFDCAYCFLNSYLNAYGIQQFVNYRDALNELEIFMRENPNQVLRVGSGEFTDSMMYDDLTGFAEECASFCDRYRNIFIELKTKSSNVDHLPRASAGNMVFAWSLNTERAIARYERGAASLNARLNAAGRAAASGYCTAFHFDPIILEGNWRQEYRKIVDHLFSVVDSDTVAWISLGCFRYSPAYRESTRDMTAARFLVAAEMFPGMDGKYRYRQSERVEAYAEILNQIKRHCDTFVYLCMETPAVWRLVFGREFQSDGELEHLFADHLREKFVRRK